MEYFQTFLLTTTKFFFNFAKKCYDELGDDLFGQDVLDDIKNLQTLGKFYFSSARINPRQTYPR